MPSTFTWLDHSENARRRALDAIDLYRQPDTRDELGLASIRDGFAGLFSPGTSTIQTRARYFLMIPWLYQRVELGRSSQPAATRARSAELDLIAALLAQDDHRGLIGQHARRTLKRLPSGVYWQGLNSWGIRPVPVAQDAYHRWIDAGTATPADTSEEGDPVHGIWHAGLPVAPEDFPGTAVLALQANEAEYLVERIAQRWPASLLAWLVQHGGPVDGFDFPWLHPDLHLMPAPLQHQLHQARLFSEVLHGAQLLYNLLLARQAELGEQVEAWEQDIAKWEARLANRGDALAAWELDEFWSTLASTGAAVPRPTRRFCSSWIEHARAGTGSLGVAHDKVSEDLIRVQEAHVKGRQARLANRSMLEAWGGNSGSTQLSYRWAVTKDYVAEIREARHA
ncbi:MAG: hypothetical protein V7607_5869 [Solirubrobacteraceae bacterium]